MDINFNYVIFNYTEVNKIDFNEVFETSIETLRINFDDTKTLVKWIGDEPNCVKNLISKSKVYNIDEITEIMNQPEWSYNNSTSGKTEN